MSREITQQPGAVPEWAIHIRKLRKNLGYTQQQLAHALHVSQAIVSYWEKGTNEPANQNWAALASLGDFGYFVSRLSPTVRDLATAVAGVKVEGVEIPILKNPLEASSPQLVEESHKIGRVFVPQYLARNAGAISLLSVSDCAMLPLFKKNDLVAVDSTVTEKKKLSGSIVAAYDLRSGFIVRKLGFTSGRYSLASESGDEIVLETKQVQFRLLGKVIWWLSSLSSIEAENVPG
jgi:transcriptional regulator with XRE-family HTH domain